ncbi:uncharacterized protein LOC135077263 [Ostrinia nubilalis]|uniref:uncharacterized protein LOC135077263 n=1 Tax=Ostrinia nubilalis TaxID=29057 RepID=UPI0030825D02
MLHTPPTTRRAALQQRKTGTAMLGRDGEHVAADCEKVHSVKSEPVQQIGYVKNKKTASCDTKSRSKDSHKSSAKRKQLILEAAKEKAKIKMELIDKALEAKLAALSDEEDLEVYSPHTSLIDGDELPRHIEQWVEHQSTHIEPEEQHGVTTCERCPPGPASHATCPPAHVAAAVVAAAATAIPASHDTCPPAHAVAAAAAVPAHPALDSTLATLNSTVHLLASALQQLSTTASANTVPNASLLSRISTPKDLPEFSGDLLEWLQFKQAYEESSAVCNFTEKENLWRLRKCLRGAAKEAVSALFISATTPDKVMATLELRFGNPEAIISRILQDLNKLQPLQMDYHKDIVAFAVKVQSFVEAVRAVGREEYLRGFSIVNTILNKLPTVLIAKWADYSYNIITDGQEPRLVILSEFLHKEAVKISATCQTSIRPDHQKPTRSHTVLVQAEESESMCQFCKKSTHKLTDCKQFKKALRKTRWQYIKRNGLCFKCLLSKHERDTCKAPVCDRDGCGQAHHWLLHYNNNNNNASNTERRPTTAEQSPAAASSTRAPTSATTNVQDQRSSAITSVPPETLTFINASDRVLLKVVSVRVSGPNGAVDSTALLDDGSSVSLMSASLAARVGLRGRRCAMRVRGAFGDSELQCDSTVVNVDLTGMDNKVHNIRMRCVDELNLPLQTLSILNCVNYSHLKDIKDKLCKSDLKPELLIGQDNHHLLLPSQIKLGKLNEPSATLTPLGWCVHGRMCLTRAPGHRRRPAAADAETNLFISESDEASVLRELHEEVRRSFILDSVGVSCRPRQNAEEVRAVALLEESASLRAGRWRVRLPCLPDAYPAALTRMKGIERKMCKDPGFAKRYEERVNHLLENDYASELMDPATTTDRTWYLPHFGVDNPNKGKLRLVFDAACKVNGNSLNDYLLTGPDLLSSLLGIILRFRENSIAVTGDIRDMFLRIKIHAEDQDALRFLWRDSPTEPMKTYVMTSLIFGANCSPFIAQFIKNKNALRLASQYPAAAIDAICKSHYMDDYIDSIDDEASAVEMVKNVSDIHRAGGFEIRNWTSNSVAVLNSVPKETLGSAAVKFKVGQQHESERTLGMMWYPADDTLGFDLSLKRIPECIIEGTERPTKRLMLKQNIGDGGERRRSGIDTCECERDGGRADRLHCYDTGYGNTCPGDVIAPRARATYCYERQRLRSRDYEPRPRYDSSRIRLY